jgi:hypothetical protein
LEEETMRKNYLLVGGAAVLVAASTASAVPTVSTFLPGSLYNLDGTLPTTNSQENPFGTYDVVAAEGFGASAFLIGDAADPTDNVVNFDGAKELTQRHLGAGAVTPSVTESFIVNPNGSQTITVTMTSVAGGDLFVGGFADNLGNPLDRAVFFIGGLGDVMDASPTWGLVKSAQIDMLVGGASIFGGAADITGLLASPWDGFAGVGVTGGVGIGIDTVIFTLNVNKVPTPGAFALFGIAGLAATRRRR